MPVLSRYARRRKLGFFLPFCTRSDRMLDVGSGSGWLADRLRERGFPRCVRLDLKDPADIVGDIRAWPSLGLEAGSFDVIFAFELLEHVECVDDLRALLRPGGLLMLTTPVPSADGILRLLEAFHLSQRRTSAHCNLRDIRSLPHFATVAYRRVAGLAQWGIYQKRSP